MEGLFSIRQAAQYLSCSEAMLRKWITHGKLPVVKIGRLTRLRLEDLKAWARVGLRDDARGGAK